MSCSRCLVLGGGGHARVVIDALRRSGVSEPCAIVDSDASRWGALIDGVKIVGGDDQLPSLLKDGIVHFVMGLAGAGNNAPRRRLFLAALEAGFEPLSVIHPSAVISPAAVLATGVQIFALAVVNAGARVGTNVIINTGAIVEHDCEIGAHSHLASRATLGGSVVVRESAHLGAGCTVRQGCIIGSEAVVGIGAAVISEVADNVVVGGVPAHILKQC